MTTQAEPKSRPLEELAEAAVKQHESALFIGMNDEYDVVVRHNTSKPIELVGLAAMSEMVLAGRTGRTIFPDGLIRLWDGRELTRRYPDGPPDIFDLDTGTVILLDVPMVKFVVQKGSHITHPADPELLTQLTMRSQPWVLSYRSALSMQSAVVHKTFAQAVHPHVDECLDIVAEARSRIAQEILESDKLQYAKASSVWRPVAKHWQLPETDEVLVAGALTLALEAYQKRKDFRIKLLETDTQPELVDAEEPGIPPTPGDSPA